MKDELGRLLKEAFPDAFNDTQCPCWKPAVKGSLAKQALAVQACITLAQRSAEGLDDAARKKDADFMKWLVSDSKTPARVFVDAINKAKVAEEAQAVSMMGDLRVAYADLGKKAISEIKGIADPDSVPVNRQLYPIGKKELEKKVKDILATKPGRGASAEQQDALNMVNAYRLLCNVTTSMSYDPGYRKDAQDAAEACKKAGTISHGLGHSTDKCNLHMNSRIIPPAASVVGYIDDQGGNNRERRSHRAWILYPQSRKTAFGVDGGFHAMRTQDTSGTPQKTARSYPGRGFFPANYLQGMVGATTPRRASLWAAPPRWKCGACPGASRPRPLKRSLPPPPRFLSRRSMCTRTTVPIPWPTASFLSRIIPSSSRRMA